jgi:hypothetical protein
VISVLLPSRGRAASLEATVRGLRDLARRPDLVEVLVAADPDDEPTRTAQLGWPSRVWAAPERYGYGRLHEYVNRLAGLASGEWLLLWNDDAGMLTEKWDQVISSQPPAVLWPWTNDQPGCNVFPAWPRSWTRCLGHVSLSPHCDSWMQEIGHALGRQHRIPVRAWHDTFRLTGGHRDATYAESLAGHRTAEFWGAEMTAARQADIGRLREFLRSGTVPIPRG